MGIVKTVVFIVFLLLGIIFAYYNLQIVEVKFYTYSFKVPLFLLILGSFGLGLFFPFFYYSLREMAFRRREENLYSFFSLFWRGYLGKALSLFRRHLTREEFIPLYIEIKREFKEPVDVRLDLYREGIAETALAEEKVPKDLEGARVLLESALGKNRENLRAKRLLRSIYLLSGDLDKAEALQREILTEIEKERRDHEQRVLSTILAEKYLKERNSAYIKELWKLPISELSGAVLASVEKAEKVFKMANELGILSEVVKIMEERNLLNVDVLNLIQNYRYEIRDDVLYYIYQRLNMQDQISDLEIKNPDLKLVKDNGGKLLSIVCMWECKECGKEYKNFSSVCPNCLSINSFKIILKTN